ncbi:hypothetical protein OBBRIDRAFT_804902 [Obba rivulosa]|uniref:Uncharacterized protein n=1 Tax=Obba rivulosa TaxID=1052685 RepID=A0A8E2DID0_9APHY|nr:hypothetical protein OBBRIDRAFT_804902 [Obba rivulosa]
MRASPPATELPFHIKPKGLWEINLTGRMVYFDRCKPDKEDVWVNRRNKYITEAGGSDGHPRRCAKGELGQSHVKRTLAYISGAVLNSEKGGIKGFMQGLFLQMSTTGCEASVPRRLYGAGEASESTSQWLGRVITVKTKRREDLSFWTGHPGRMQYGTAQTPRDLLSCTGSTSITP